MDLTHSLRLRQQQKLVMTPQLQQVIRLLQLPTMELIEQVRQELESNPALEEGPPEPGLEPDAEGVHETPAAAEGPEADDGMDAWLKLAADEGPRETRDRQREEEMEQRRENRLVGVETLQVHLLDQLHETEGDGAQVRLAEMLVGNLDDNGYLTTPLEELAGPAGVPVQVLEGALTLVQSLEPTGVGARDLKECLLLQLQPMKGDTALAVRIVSEHLAALEVPGPAGHAKIAKALGVAPEAVEAALKQIRACDPKPGGQFAPPPQTVFPDVRVEKVEGQYVVGLNDAGLPPLRLSQAYREMLADRAKLGKAEREFLQERFRSALMLMRGIEQRRVNLHKVVDHIVKTQRDFLDRGPAHLVPLTLREVADAIGVHESTVSRIVANKYVATPRGTLPLRTFFSNRLPGASSAGASGTAVRERIRELVETEPAAAPRSDDQLADLLRSEGIAIARRTVTKYREALKIPAAWQRRQNRSSERSSEPNG
ncbi:MAG: RNA polymerase factor sigma-54 [Candidatus Coatesbacteria bacterium]